MHVGIVIPLKSKKISRDWQVTCQSLHATLRSIENQTNRSFTAIVVGHEKPDFLAHDFPNIMFESIDIPPPDRTSKDFTHQKLVEDKNLKILQGLISLKKTNVFDYWYQLDADDLIRYDFVESLSSLTEESGVLINGGLIFYSAQNRYIYTKELSVHCGSTSVISNSIISVPPDIKDDLVSNVPWLSISHKNMLNFFIENHNTNFVIQNLPVVAYNLNTGDNISENWRRSIISKFKSFLKPYLLGKKISNDLLIKFGQAEKEG
ncbi:hypothetical protein FJN13_12880 [Alteromonas mediterranea]|uniref:hypothetical protein n=1 Tax=Alteromonas mediterranea TaxID=314275 RepID=UPI001130E6BD|nr:hypothetical protein [Alteromonas mediterranea]QDG35635.1 hypothetical protein FJN13_12880 [Alteromonas mediterranea]